MSQSIFIFNIHIVHHYTLRVSSFAKTLRCWKLGDGYELGVTTDYYDFIIIPYLNFIIAMLLILLKLPHSLFCTFAVSTEIPFCSSLSIIFYIRLSGCKVM